MSYVEAGHFTKWNSYTDRLLNNMIMRKFKNGQHSGDNFKYQELYILL